MDRNNLLCHNLHFISIQNGPEEVQTHFELHFGELELHFH